SGQTLSVPFDQLLIFSTNLEPQQLVDEAFLRRIRYKIFVPDPGPYEFRMIFEKVCAARRITFGEDAYAQLEAFYAEHGIPRRACHPRDLMDQLVDIATFRDEEPALSPELLELACQSYFVSLE